jgi:hypothetical protein
MFNFAFVTNVGYNPLNKKNMKPGTKSIKTNRREIVEDLVNAFGLVESKEKIYESYDYGIFRYRETNRDLDHSRVKRIADNILEKGLLFAPIILNENMEVVDGQHRLAAIKYLNTLNKPYPVLFSIQPGYTNAQMISFNKNLDKWKKRDYLKHYVVIGSRAYVEFNNFLDTFPWLPQTGAEALFAMNQNGINSQRYKSVTGVTSIVDGVQIDNETVGRRKTFEDGEMATPTNLEELYAMARNIEKIAPYYSGYNRAFFIRTMVTLFKTPGFDFERFFKKLRTSGGTKYPLTNVGSVEQYREKINLIYNHGAAKADYLELRLPK